MVVPTQKPNSKVKFVFYRWRLVVGLILFVPGVLAAREMFYLHEYVYAPMIVVGGILIGISADFITNLSEGSIIRAKGQDQNNQTSDKKK